MVKSSSGQNLNRRHSSAGLKRKIDDDENKTSKKQNSEQVRAVEQALPLESNQRETPKIMKNKRIENEVKSRDSSGTKPNKSNQEMRKKVLEQLTASDKNTNENSHVDVEMIAYDSKLSPDESKEITRTIEEVISRVVDEAEIISSSEDISKNLCEKENTNDADELELARQKKKERYLREGAKNDDHLPPYIKSENEKKETQYPRQRYEIQLTGDGLMDFKDIYSRLKELERCKGIDNPILIQPAIDEDKKKHLLNIAVNNFEDYLKLREEWPLDAFRKGVIVTDRPPHLPIIINNVDKNIPICPNDIRVLDLKNRYGVIDLERIYVQDKMPTNKVKANVLTLWNYIDLVTNGIYLDITSMKHTIKPVILYSHVCGRCGNPNHNQKENKCRERCLRCGDYDHTLSSCRNNPQCINCSGNHQCNNDICEFLINKTLSSNKYTIDVLLKEGVINSVDEILRSHNFTQGKQVSYEMKSMEEVMNKLIENKLATQSSRLSDLEKITQKHSGEIQEMRNDIKLVKTELGEVNSKIDYVKADLDTVKTDLRSVNEVVSKTNLELKANQSSIESYFKLVLSRMDGQCGPASSSSLNH
ncbi:unnamed protein product [Brachionus calyciflorus]|uniref:Uncharacterized protein n=1 Tax=Brachionus calyciflorus TaxID=104777 RepID=A0A814MZ95_9BILA|nr:unnamed protein product [Brachionus calyciflorus]